MKSKFFRSLCVALIASFCFVHVPAQAGMLPTESALEISAERAKAIEFFQRADVTKALESQGIAPEQAQARVAALSDDEIMALNGKIDTLPAGGDILGLIFTVFIILLVTDILGLTKVFPFTKSIR